MVGSAARSSLPISEPIVRSLIGSNWIIYRMASVENWMPYGWLLARLNVQLEKLKLKIVSLSAISGLFSRAGVEVKEVRAF